MGQQPNLSGPYKVFVVECDDNRLYYVVGPTIEPDKIRFNFLDIAAISCGRLNDAYEAGRASVLGAVDERPPRYGEQE